MKMLCLSFRSTFTLKRVTYTLIIVTAKHHVATYSSGYSSGCA